MRKECGERRKRPRTGAKVQAGRRFEDAAVENTLFVPHGKESIPSVAGSHDKVAVFRSDGRLGR